MNHKIFSWLSQILAKPPSHFVKDLLELRSQYLSDASQHTFPGKSVSIVGPADYLLGLRLGRKIDSSDYTVRFNTVMDFLPLDEALTDDIGRKTDIIYLAPSNLGDYINLSPGKIRNAIETSGTKYFFFQSTMAAYVNDSSHPSYETILGHKTLWDDFMSQNNLSIPVTSSHETGSVVSRHLSAMAGTPHMARMGFLSICDLIVRGCDKLNLFGMTFYHGGGHLFRPDSIETLNPTLRHDGKESVHNSEYEFILLKELVDGIGVEIELDHKMRELISKSS